jgi:uncharacterized membrane protein YkvA (DUF1232 family)
MTAWREHARRLREDVVAVALAIRDPRVPWQARALGAVIVALSPVDLIPDFVPVIGYLDDLVLVPLGLILMLRFIPADVLAEHRAAAAGIAARPVSFAGAAVVILVWALSLGLAAWWMRRMFVG